MPKTKLMIIFLFREHIILLIICKSNLSGETDGGGISFPWATLLTEGRGLLVQSEKYE